MLTLSWRPELDTADKKDIRDAIKWFGEVNQLEKLAEECGELVSAIARCKQHPNSMEIEINMVEEMADVFIVLEQLDTLFMFKRRAMPQKLKRLESIVLEEKNEHNHSPETGS